MGNTVYLSSWVAQSIHHVTSDISILLLFVLVLQAQAAPPIREAADSQSPLKMKRGVPTSAEKKAEEDLLDLLNETESKNKREAVDDPSPLKMKRRVPTSAEKKAEEDLLDLLNETESKNKRE